MSELATDKTEWPEKPLASNIKPFIDTFFDILDNNTEDAGERLAKEIFATDGYFGTASKGYTGSEEIAGCCGDRWAMVKNRAHYIDKVYTCNEEGSDLLMIGHSSQDLKIADIHYEGELIARMILEKVGTPNMRIKYFRVWGDSGPLMKLLGEKGIKT
ncbi:hypothetical protein K432DRAFT_332005 [Lepidopterella palustris CBS 459.81]|uniref:SnoaL-like domain-containing protein n=1 Tax=Lepidopterella palustris CBS 459.81 TaxID=1314670 RepID=A0A8E2E7B0_9PEZI|nr:hypothetical protein K432DRAFT_332005 [Lepidopterella palustris CBS 459.81]